MKKNVSSHDEYVFNRVYRISSLLSRCEKNRIHLDPEQNSYFLILNLITTNIKLKMINSVNAVTRYVFTQWIHNPHAHMKLPNVFVKEKLMSTYL